MTLDNAILILLGESRIKLEEKEKAIINLTEANNSLANQLMTVSNQLAHIQVNYTRLTEVIKASER